MLGCFAVMAVLVVMGWMLPTKTEDLTNAEINARIAKARREWDLRHGA